MLERRQNRSASRATALTLFLEQVGRESHLGAVALVSESGDLVARAGDFRGRLAASVPGAYAGDEPSSWETSTGGRDLYARRVDVQGTRFYLASVGSAVRHARRAEDGIRRILLDTAAA